MSRITYNVFRMSLAATLSVIALLAPVLAHAHVLEFNNGIGAVLHMDPQDEPVAGQQTSFYFAFSDNTGGFSARNCDCSLTIKQAGNTVLETPLTAQAADSGTASYIFPTRDVYELVVSGKPTGQATFGNFSLNYTVRVDKGTGTPLSTTDYRQRGIYLTASGIGLVVVFLLARNIIVYNVKYYGEQHAKPRNAHQRKPR